jgi:hypothetical protein
MNVLIKFCFKIQSRELEREEIFSVLGADST